MCTTQQKNEAGTRILELQAEIWRYRQAVREAMEALESAEQELDDVLEANYQNEGGYDNV